MRLYVSGPITGDPDYREKFARATARLEAVGYEVVNPADLAEPDVPEPAWLDYMRRDIIRLMECDGVATLDDWTTSRGARVEVTLANGLGLPTSCISGWVVDAPLMLRLRP